MSSASQSNGTATITVTFESGTDIDRAQMDTQNRLRRVEARLPEEVRRQGIQVNRANAAFLMVVALHSPNGAQNTLDLGNFATSRVIDELRLVNGVGDVPLFGSEYARRIWLDPAKLVAYNLAAAEALEAVREQNSQIACGQIGDQPTAPGAALNATVVTQNRFTRPEQFEQIILRANPDGSTVRLSDVGRVELGAVNYAMSARLDGKPMAGMAIQLATGANALSASRDVRAKMAELSQGIPAGIEWAVPFDKTEFNEVVWREVPRDTVDNGWSEAREVRAKVDELLQGLPAVFEWAVPFETTAFIEVSLTEVAKTLGEAMILVFLVMYRFLQNGRATIIPTIVGPIALLGSCIGLWMLGFSINVLTLFGMVLAIGILVDDAIVVIENVERVMEIGRAHV